MNNNPLYGKRIVFDGDSICYGGSEISVGENRGWPYRIGAKNAMEWYNYGVNSATITAETYSERTGAPLHWLTRYIDEIHEKHPTLDYIIFEGGTNDSDRLGGIGSARLGELDIADFSGNYDDTTFTGALESLFYKTINYYPRAKIGFIIVQKTGVRTTGYGENAPRRYYFLRAIEVCKKWGVPYIDLWGDCPLNPALTAFYDKNLDVSGNRAAGKAYIDGTHLTSEGYDYVSPMIEAWLKSL